MKLYFSIAILFSLVIASGLGSAAVQAQSTPETTEPPFYPSECDDMPRDTIEEKIEKRECRVAEAQRGVDYAPPSRVSLWVDELEIRQAGLDKLLAKQAEEAATTPVPEATPEATPEPTPTPEPTISQNDNAVIEALTAQLEALTTHMELLAMQLEELSNQMEASESANQMKVSESTPADFPMLELNDEGFRSAELGFSLGIPYSTPRGITMLDDQLYIVIVNYHKVFVYNIDGTMDFSSDFRLDVDNRYPDGITTHDGKLWVVDGLDAKVYVYNSDGTRDAASDFDLDADNTNSVGITALNDKFWIVDDRHGKVFAYNADGTRDAASDFIVRGGGSSMLSGDGLEGITAHDDKLLTSSKFGALYVYNQDGTRDLSHSFADALGYQSFTYGITIHDGKMYSLISQYPGGVYEDGYYDGWYDDEGHAAVHVR